MRKVRVLALILVAMLSAFLFCGCAESFTVSSYVDKNGALHNEYLLTYDVAAEDADAVKQAAQTAMRRYVEEEGVSEFATIDAEQAGQIVLSVVYPSLTDYYLHIGKEPTKAGDLVRSGLINTYDEEVSSYLTEDNLALVRSLLDEAYSDFSLDGVKLYYRYGTTNKTTRSNGVKSEEDGVYFHIWEIVPGTQSNMKLRYYGLNGIVLYSIIISVFVLSLAIIFVILYINKRKEMMRRSVPHGEEKECGEGDPSSDEPKE